MFKINNISTLYTWFRLIGNIDRATDSVNVTLATEIKNHPPESCSDGWIQPKTNK